MAEHNQRIIKFIRAQVGSLAQDRCQALVQVESAGAGLCTGTADGGDAPLDGLRAAARAAADAVTEAIGIEGVSVRVRGVQQVDAFGQTVVIVSVAASRDGKHQTLLGVCDTADEPVRAAALAVLNATNRFLGRG
ncbi:MAG: hypothetical protein HY560_00830 [Gemmatimonadetes bacterium]|nr:hypothetical protein [Gemmatimonadota bacterium]